MEDNSRVLLAHDEQRFPSTRQHGDTPVVGENLCVEVRTQGETRILLNGVNFTARPGELTAIMGPSGSGKTTLLNAIAGKSNGHVDIKGTVYYRGVDSKSISTKDFVGFVRQEDEFLEYLTVRETILFAARLRMKNQGYLAQTSRTDKLIQELSLESCQHVKMGGKTFKGVSGGQRKRVAIAVALISRPDVLILDEPTSGLDSALAYDVMRTLDGLASHWNTTIICTVHQPRSQIFGFFDSLILLRHGHIVYEGESAYAVDYFAQIGYNCPSDFNPADFFLDLLADQNEDDQKTVKDDDTAGLEPKFRPLSIGEPPLINQTVPEDDIQQVIASSKSDRSHQQQFEEHLSPSSDKFVISIGDADRFADLYAKSFKYKERKAYQDQLLADLASKGDTEFQANRAAGSAIYDWLRSVYILFLRGVIEGKRRPQNVYVALGGAIFMSLVVGSIWWKVEKVDDLYECNPPKIRNILGGVLQIVANDIFNCYECGCIVVERRPLVNREVSEKLYHRSAAFVGQLLADGLFNYWGMFLTSLIIYWTIGLRATAYAFFIWLIFLWLLKFTIVGYATLCGALAPTTEVAFGLMPLGIVLMFMVAGLQLSDDKVPKWLQWLQVLSPIRYIYQTVARSQFEKEDYLDICQGFRTPRSTGENFAIALSIAIFFRMWALIANSFCWRRIGLS